MQYVMDQLTAVGAISMLVYLLVLLGGVVSALSPCFVPVLAMFGGYIGGYAKDARTHPLRIAIAFTSGQAVTLAVMGVAAVMVGKSVLALFTGYELDRYIPATIGIIMGLHLLGVFKFHFPLIGRLKAKRPENVWGAFTLGLPFGLVVTPCTIPIFLTIIAYLALQASILHGALLMVAYALGRGVILGVVAYSAGTLKTLRDGKVARHAERISGGILVLASLYLLFFYQFSRMPIPSL